jgi:hypothetical protein
MGMEQEVTFAESAPPPWSKVAELLAKCGFAVQIRMIDGELAFPEEAPPENWRELRVGTAAGMVTVRREGNRLSVVVWGNADPALCKAWNALTWAIAEAGGGRIVAADAPLSGLPGLRGAGRCEDEERRRRSLLQ